MRKLLEPAVQWAKSIKRDVLALWLAAADPRTPLFAKLTAAVVAAYALSPIDLIPDFVPVLGYVDDLLVVPLGILLAVRLIPTTLFAEFRVAAAALAAQPVSRAGLLAIVTIWILSTASLLWLFWPSKGGSSR